MAEDISARKRSEEMRAEITAMINHDLRAPISALSFWIENMLLGTYGKVDEEADETLKRSSRNLQTVLSLLDDLLDAEKLEDGSMKAVSSNFMIQDCLHHLKNLYEDWC